MKKRDYSYEFKEQILNECWEVGNGALVDRRPKSRDSIRDDGCLRN